MQSAWNGKDSTGNFTKWSESPWCHCFRYPINACITSQYGKLQDIKSCICVLGVRGINFTFVTTIFLFIFWNCSDSKLFFIFHFISMFTFYCDQKSNYFNNYPIFGKNEFTTFFLYKCDAVIDAIAHLLDPKQNLSKKLVF